MYRIIKSSSSRKYLLKDLNGNYYFSKESTGRAWTEDKSNADIFDSREDVIDFGNKYFNGTYLYGKDWSEVVASTVHEDRYSYNGDYDPYGDDGGDDYDEDDYTYVVYSLDERGKELDSISANYEDLEKAIYFAKYYTSRTGEYVQIEVIPGYDVVWSNFPD